MTELSRKPASLFSVFAVSYSYPLYCVSLVFSVFHRALLYISVLFMLSNSALLLPFQLASYHLAEHLSANSVK